MARWLINPSHGSKRTRRKPPKGFKSWGAWSKSMRARKGKGSPVAKRRKRRRARRNPGLLANPRRRRRRATVKHVIRYRNRPRGRRRHRRNPALFKGGTRGIVSQLTRGVVNGTWVLVGEAATNALPSLVGMNQAGVMGMAVKAVAATVAGMLAKQFVGANAADYVTAGGFAALVRPTIKALNIPVLSGALGDTFPEYFMGAYAREEQIGAYAQESGELDAALLYS